MKVYLCGITTWRHSRHFLIVGALQSPDDYGPYTSLSAALCA